VTWVWPVVPARDLPALTADEMRQVDRVMIEDLGIELIQMMENAGLHLAELARSRFSRLRDVPVTVLAGGGNNGGGGLVCARHLANWGAPVSVVLDRSPNEITGVPAHQMRILRRMGLSFLEEPPASPGLIVDALIGYGLSDDPKGPSAELIERANGTDAPTPWIKRAKTRTQGSQENPPTSEAAPKRASPTTKRRRRP
jgi:NAD(P)H-hydrate epimerase